MNTCLITSDQLNTFISSSLQVFLNNTLKKKITHTMEYLIGSRYLCSESNNHPTSPFKTRWKFNHFQFNAITVSCITATSLIFTTALFSEILSFTSFSLPFKIIDRPYFLKPMTTMTFFPRNTESNDKDAPHLASWLSQEGVSKQFPEKFHSEYRFMVWSLKKDS